MFFRSSEDELEVKQTFTDIIRVDYCQLEEGTESYDEMITPSPPTGSKRLEA